MLQRWAALLEPGGRLLLIEGFWHTGGGLHARESQQALPPSFVNVHLHDLSPRANLWGGTVGDERYILTARLSNPGDR